MSTYKLGGKMDKGYIQWATVSTVWSYNIMCNISYLSFSQSAQSETEKRSGGNWWRDIEPGWDRIMTSFRP